MEIFSTLKQGIQYAAGQLRKYGTITDPTSWQGIKQEYKMFEVDNVYFRCCMPSTIMALQEQVSPDLPWAEDHFAERVYGKPLNPGSQYLMWPGYKDKDFNDKHFRANGKFTHTYMERYWPKNAGEVYLSNNSVSEVTDRNTIALSNSGIRYQYGDLQDVINLLANDHYTRQAYLPVWFPEDTGVLHKGRVPCTIGYHFMRKGDDFHVNYTIRACDYIRHFRNDIYLTVRLVQWMLEKISEKWFEMTSESEQWRRVKPGIFTMNIMHFHVFEKEKNLI